MRAFQSPYRFEHFSNTVLNVSLILSEGGISFKMMIKADIIGRLRRFFLTNLIFGAFVIALDFGEKFAE